MNSPLENLFRVDFMPHGHCYLWKPEILWLNVLSDALIALSYFSIPVALYYFVWKREDLEFKGIFILFSLFIALCGITHLIGIVTVWNGAYGIHGMAKFATAVVSVMTAIQLCRMLPQALLIPSPREIKRVFEKANFEKEQRIKLEYQRKQDEILRQSTDAAHIGVLVVNDSGDILMANLAVCEMFGYRKEDLEGKPVSLLVGGVEAEKHDQLLASFFASPVLQYKMAPEREVMGVTKNGQQLPVEIVLNVGETGGQKVVYASVMDISERRRIELERAEKAQQLQMEKESFKSLFENLPDPCFVIDPKSSKIIKCNPAFEKMMNASSEQLIGLTKYDISPEFQEHVNKSSKDYYTKITEHLVPGESVQFEWKHNRMDGETFIASVSVSYVAIEGQEVFLSCWRDITELKQKEQELIEARNQAVEAEKTKSDFLANMSHEIRTPMNAILGLTQLISEMPLEKKASEYMEKVQNSSHSLLNVLNDILDFSKLEAGKLSIVNEPVDLEKVLSDVTGLFSLTAENKAIELVIDYPVAEPRWVYADSMRLTQVLNNLVGNAIKFTDSGYVKVSLNIEKMENDQLQARFCVEDTGIGIAHEKLDSLLSPFNQVDASINRRFGGTGLGLAISNHLLGLMGSHLEISSELGQGSCFCFSLCFKTCSSESSKERQLAGKRTLVVDDNEASRLALQRMLSSWGFPVELASSGEEALHLTATAESQNQPFELFLIDWKMPKMDGLELIKQIQSRLNSTESTQPTILLVTAFGRDFVQQSITEQRVDAVLDKPFLASTLHDALVQIQYQDSSLIAGNVSKQALDDDYQPTYEGAHVLVVEDNETNQLVAREFLAKFGIKAVVVCNGLEAVDYVKQNQKELDLILMDLQMPKMDGFEASKLIKADSRSTHIPIVAMSAAVLKSDREKVKAAGINGHIAKPVDIRELAQVLGTNLSSNAQSPSHTHQQAKALQSFEGSLPTGFDFNSALKRLGGDIKLLHKMAESTLVVHKDATAKLTDLFESEDKQSLRSYCHTLKSVLSGLGAQDIADVAGTIEMSDELLNSREFSRFVTQLDEHLLALRNWLDQQSPRVPEVKFSEELLAEGIKNLAEKIQARRIINEDEIVHFLKLVSAQWNAQQQEEFKTAIIRFDYDLAMQKINALNL
ncbi:hybrid sensor histidine kinase/response regulator [Planctobacterium marinum]|uniref:Sensory/regulatory protein RpfC n=1 Tax=Planctobacterium marinum TaxID=1631968 RepID=A0AA48KQC1_9ALTE|nr:hypothetical protein MACH26_04430 [Planctobacterium marinum]